MQIILVEDVYELGKRGEVLNVAKGYGRNYLIPKGLAIKATPGNLKTIEQQRLALAKKEGKHREEAELLAAEITQLHIIVSRKAGESGTLFGSVSTKDLCDLLKKEGIQLDRRRILLPQPVKAIGNYQVKTRPHSDVEAELLVSVLVEGDKPVARVKRKDEESDRIVAETNAKVKEMGLAAEGRVVGGGESERAPLEAVAKEAVQPEAPAADAGTKREDAPSAQEEPPAVSDDSSTERVEEH